MSDSKSFILTANEHIKSAASLFEKIYQELKLDPMLVENANIAFGELIKCVKHIALIHGEITGNELMPPAPKESVN